MTFQPDHVLCIDDQDSMSESDITIHLPSLIHRINGDNTKTAQAIALQFGCELKRIRRSRHWKMTGKARDIQMCCEALQQAHALTMQFVIAKVNETLLLHQDKLETLSEKLNRLIHDNPNITLTELMAMTHCTLAEARTARFASDVF